MSLEMVVVVVEKEEMAVKEMVAKELVVKELVVKEMAVVAKVAKEIHHNPRILDNCKLEYCCQTEVRLGMACKSSRSLHTDSRMHS